jgi:hypothetical protein
MSNRLAIELASTGGLAYLACHQPACVDVSSEGLIFESIFTTDPAVFLEQFGKLLTTYAGWGMRIEFVPEDEVHRRPALEVREPELETQGE